jgi:hypothetical protein
MMNNKARRENRRAFAILDRNLARQQRHLGHQGHQNLDVTGHGIADVAGLADLFKAFFLGQQSGQDLVRIVRTLEQTAQIAVTPVILMPESGGADQQAWAAEIGQDGAKIGHGALLETEVVKVTQYNFALRCTKAQRAMVTTLFKKSKQLSIYV